MANIFKQVENKLTGFAPRTKFPVDVRHTMSFDAGRLNVAGLFEVLPGDTWQLDLHALLQMQTPIAPIMDDIYGDFYFFFVPNRILASSQDQFEKVMSISDWSGFNTGELATFSISSVLANGSTRGGFTVHPGDLANQLGLPIGHFGSLYNGKISVAPWRGYVEIWNYYFRDENYQSKQSLVESYNPSNTADPSVLSDNWLVPNALIPANSKVAPVNERHDLFTSVLPSPQKGPSVLLPLGEYAPVIGSASLHSLGTDGFKLGDGSQGLYGGSILSVDSGGSVGSLLDNSTEKFPSTVANSTNLVADLSNAVATTINQLRESIVMQHFLETLARSGSRYKEFIKGFFDVEIGDARIQQPEFICEWHTAINISTVVQTAGFNSDDETTLGTTGAVSRTGTSANNLLTFSAPEFGYIYCLVCIRHKLSYSQGIHPLFFRKKGTDFYNPVWEGIGEVGIKKSSVLAPVGYDANLMKSTYASAGQSVRLDDELGFNEPFAEYKYFTNRTSGIMNPVAKEGLDYWTLTKAFTTANITGADIRVAGKETLDRALSIQTQPQFIADILFRGSVVRRMRKFSTPGLDRI